MDFDYGIWEKELSGFFSFSYSNWLPGKGKKVVLYSKHGF